MPNSNIRQTIPEIAKKPSGSLRGQSIPVGVESSTIPNELAI